MGDLSDIERGQIVGASLAEASVIKMATSLDLSRAGVSKVMSAYTNHWMTTSTKKNSGQKSTVRERDRRTLRRIVSKNQNYCITGERTAELHIHLEDPVSTKNCPT
jgi:hypothetical protein